MTQKKSKKKTKRRAKHPARRAAKRSAKKRSPLRAAMRKLAKVRSAFQQFTRKKPAAPRRQDATPLTEAQIQKFREILTQKRDDLLDIVQRKKEQEIQDIEVGDEADIATQSVEKEMLFELTDSEKQTLDKVEDALRKMDKGTYGNCESCRKTIPRLRLEVMPWARYCINCQSELESPPAE